MFKFNLESVLSLRESKEENSKRIFGEALDQKQIIIDKMIFIKKQKEDLEAQLIQILNNGERLDFKTINNLRNNILFLEKSLKEQSIALINANKKVEQTRLVYLEDLKQRKVLSSLKEKRQEEYILEETRKENILLDELISYKYTSNKGGE